MTWQNKLKLCVVSPCNATSCSHNKGRNCMLPKVTISEKGVCEQFVTRKRNAFTR